MRPDLRRLPFLVAFLIAGLTTAVTIRHATFVPWGTDAAGYVGAARRWADGEIFKPAPFQLWARWIAVWPNSMDAPLAYRAGPIKGTEVSIYPLGFPVFLAVADKIDPELGVYLVAPLFAGLLVWCTFLLGRRLAGPWAGVLAAFLIAASPVTLAYALTPMSDVPSAALLLLSVELSLRRSKTSAVAAGCAVAAAIMMRPILAPLGAIPFVLATTAGASRLRAWREWHWQRALLLGAFAALGPLIVGWSQQVMYGGFFNPGYPGAEAFFRREHIPLNLKTYPKNLMAVHTPVILLGVICSFVLFRGGAVPERRRLAGALCALVFLNYGLYLAYLPYDDIAYLRFVLPALAAMFLLFAGVTVWLVETMWRQTKLLAPLAIIPAAIVSVGAYGLYPWAFTQAASQRQVMLMGRYLREVLPPNAAVITFLQGGAVAHYTGRQGIRFDLMEGRQLEPIVESLVRRGYHPVFVIDQESEGMLFKLRFGHSGLGRLDWTPRAQFIGGTTIWYLDYFDRGRAPRRTDILN